jgi:hypothetical protein
MNDKTPEQVAAEAQAAADKAEKSKLQAEEKARKKAEADAKKAADKKAADEKKAADKAAAEQKKKDDAAAKEKAKADALAAKEAQKMPESNGVRRPKPETLCGKAWAIFDQISTEQKRPATIAESLVRSKEQGLNEGNVKAEFARWRKFFGISGRAPAPVAATPSQ